MCGSLGVRGVAPGERSVWWFFMTAQVLVLYFAKSAELTGRKEEELPDVPTPISSGDLWRLLLRRHPRLSALQHHVVLAVRQQYVAVGDQVVTLADGDEVAVVPPLSGG
ncbi:molybdopterin synthase sulfur carrier subunit [Amphiprion ocellaris]|uniref:molybdopterin synthase sulfur carrier subunit n=1 Tax=Amphiprion ocellaris TaxID=80972 RepID=UPI000C308611|nr:molybdopterin synthase sulfur carrier subunit [Amphiprion ocellaris]